MPARLRDTLPNAAQKNLCSSVKKCFPWQFATTVKEMVFSLVVHNNTQEKLYIFLEAEWKPQGYTFPWQFNTTPKEMINSLAVGFGH